RPSEGESPEAQCLHVVNCSWLPIVKDNGAKSIDSARKISLLIFFFFLLDFLDFLIFKITQHNL
ncbi:hypothetical protein, partial [Leptospira meyeri]|uniref:hypothetical protein n=1 Tax=Leptospira meyeri TaxID=29508 RepID=UPI00223CA5BB